MTFPVRRILYLSSVLTLACTVSVPAHAWWWGSKKKKQEKAGAVLFVNKGCTHCHGDHLQGTKKAPPIVNINHDKSWTPGRMTDQILNGGKKMPSFADSLTDQEISCLVMYLRAKHRPTLPPATATAAAATAE